MSTIQVKFDNKLKQSDIIIPLIHSSQAEAQDNYEYNQSERQQTLVYGIQTPLIMINNVVVKFSDVISFELSCSNATPEVYIVVRDRYRLTTTIDSPGIDNELRVQILPKFENKYKKINLTFYITNMKNNNGTLYINGEYKIPKFISSNIKSFGQISTYKLFETIAQETDLGFATNVEDSSQERYVYCPYKSYKELLRSEVAFASTETQIYDYWVDWWNNLILADMYERYNATDRDEDMQIWIAGQNNEISEGTEITPIQTVATFHNHPGQQTTELHVSNYKICTSPGPQLYKGTDRVFSVYEFPKTEYLDYLIQDGDSKNDIFTKYEYLGEVYDDHNYLLSNKKYDTFRQKIYSNETVEITLKTPLLGIMRGNRVNFLWYNNNGIVDDLHNKLKKEGTIYESPETNIPINEDSNIEDIEHDGKFVIDKSVSGQYLVTKCVMKYKDNAWQYLVTLSRPSSAKPKIIKEDTK